MYYHYPYTGESAYVLWWRLISKRKTGISCIKLWRQNYGDAGKSGVLWTSSITGDLSLVMDIVQKGCDATEMNNFAILLASSRGHLKVVKWLYSLGCDPTDANNLPIVCASKNGHLNVVKWLYRMGCDPISMDNWAIHQAIYNGHQDIVDFLVSVGCPDPRK